MGSSTSIIIPAVMRIMTYYKPKSILDVGIGTGKWGFLIREKAELRLGARKKDFRVIIDGIEVDARWIGPVHRYIYDKIYFVDVRKFEPEREYDIVMCGDILEHLTEEDAHKMIKKLLKCCKKLILSVPYDIKNTHNGLAKDLIKLYPYEKHNSRWSYLDFEEYEVIHFEVAMPNFIILLDGEVKEK